MCGIVGIYGYDNVYDELLFGLTALQHRGQDAAGVLLFDTTFRMKKGLGLVSNVFPKTKEEPLKGFCGIGHVRYATQGRTDLLNAQPFFTHYPFGLAMVHNGNIINFQELRKSLYENNHRLLETSNDLELILYTLATELEGRNLKNLSIDDIFASVDATQKKLVGAYSTITIIANQGFLAFTDPNGFRPLVFGMKETEKGPIYAFASESTCLDYLGYSLVRDLKGGEAIFIDKNRKIHTKQCHSAGSDFCVFEYIYFAREDSIIHKKLVASERVNMGKMLAKRFKEMEIKPDIVIDVPASAYFFASGLAEELKVPYRRGLSKNNHIGRSFISPSPQQRNLLVRQKLNPIREVIKGKKVAVVDDSIVRGTTSKHIVKLLRDCEAKNVYFVSASPPIKYPCVYGIDMSIKKEIIAADHSVDEIVNYIGADAVIYQSIDDLYKLYSDFPCCYACFSGKYPTSISPEIFKSIEEDRICSQKQ